MAMSCFAMTEPEVAGSDPTLIQTKAVRDGDDWVINGHKWFISNARRARFAILIARTEDDPEIPQAANTAFIVDLPSDGWTRVREIETMHGGTGHSEIRIENLRVPDVSCSAAGARATCSASTASGRRASRTACAGSRRPRPRST